ncbi:MAG: hypothetical protein H7Z41_01935 [Cytophagales bacterium]|nr:hypothetical protein [Armatimonadota bacterium]
MRSFFASLSIITAALCVSATSAFAQTFDFEGQRATSTPGAPTGSYTVLTETAGGVTLTLFREGNTPFDIATASPNGSQFPPIFGARTLNPFANTVGSAFIGNFSAPLSGVSVQFGDFPPRAGLRGDEDVFTLQAFSGADATGISLGSTTVTYTAALNFSNDIGVASLSGLPGIRSIRFIGGSVPGPNSVYYDNIRVTLAPDPVPEPGAVLSCLMLAGTVCVGLVRGRRLRTAAGELKSAS